MTSVEERPIGFGRLLRKEDARFIRGQGHYVDDVQLPAMLHGAVLRSPVAHARIVSIDTSAALQHPRVHAVITGADLAARGIAWMPTMSADTRAVLATDKVRFQGQEIAFVIADDRYAARDALELIDVSYEVLDARQRAAGAQDPRDLARRHRRLRQQGPGLPGLHLRDRGLADGLPDPDRRRGPRLGDRLHGHAVPAPPDRGQGDRRIRDRRLAAGDRQRHLRCAGALRRPPRRHAVYPVPGLGRVRGKGTPPQ